MPKDSADAPQNPDSESQVSLHRIYTGSFAALETGWMEAVAALQRHDPLAEVNVLVGSNILASYLKRRLAENGRPAANVRCHTFPDLMRRLVEPSALSAMPSPLPPLGPAILLESLLAGSVPEAYAALAGYKGFRDALLETFRDLRDADIAEEDLDRILRTGRSDSDRNRHRRALADLYRAYRKEVGRFHDVDDDYRTAIERLAHCPRGIGMRHLLVYGIYDATGQQLRLLTALKHALSLTYFIPFADAAVSDFARPFLESRAADLGVPALPLDPPPLPTSLGQLRARAFGFAQETERTAALPADGSYALVSAPGESRAAIEIIREILRAVHEGVIAGFHEAAVILRQPETDLPVLTEMLRLRGIPYFVQGGGRFADRPISKAVLALSGLEPAGFSREAILVAMELIAASLPESAARMWDVPAWRMLTNDPRFLAGLRAWDAATQAIVDQARHAARRELPWEGSEENGSPADSPEAAGRRLESARLLREGWLLLRSAAAEWPASLSWQDWALFLEQRLGCIFDASPDWPRFLAVLDEIANLQVLHQPETGISKAGGRCSAAGVRAALADSIASLTYPIGRFQRSGVNLLSASSARGLQFPLVLIPGLDEGRFPSKLRQDPLLPDSERIRLQSLPLRARRMDEEKLLFDMAARSAQKRLVLMTSRLDEGSDRERIPSHFFLRAAEAVRGDRVSLRDLAEGLVPGFRSVSLEDPAPEPGALAVDEGEIRLRLIASEKSLARQVLEALMRLDPLRLKRPLEYDQARWQNTLTAYDGRIGKRQLVQWAAQKIGATAGQVSASRFEEYAKCPYCFFLKRVQDLAAWEEPGKVEGMDPLERGTAVHAILENFLKNCAGESFASVPREKLAVLLQQLARSELDKARPAAMPDLLWEIERDALLKVLGEWLEFELERADGSMRIARLEQAFGSFPGTEAHPPYTLPTPMHSFDFRGRIDRIDISRDGKHARVTDYKTGMLPESLTRRVRPPLMGGEKIQLAIYRGALGVLGGFEDLDSVDGEYLYLQPRDGQVRACCFTHEELEASSRALSHVLQILGAGMETGVFFPKTSGTVYPAGHCEYCDYLMICGKDRMKREARKSADPAVVRFMQILEPPQ